MEAVRKFVNLKMREYALMVLVSGFVAVARGQIVGFGPCPPIDAVSPFDMPAFSGKWYEANYLSNFSLPVEERCTTVTLDNDRNGNWTLTVNRVLYVIIHIPISSTAKVDISTPAIGDMTLHFNNALWPISTKVVATDYNNYALTYSCVDLISTIHLSFVSIWSRKPSVTVPPTYNDKALEAFEQLNITDASLVFINHAACSYAHAFV